MPEVFDTANDAIDSFDGSETFDEAEYPLRDFPSKEIGVSLSTRVRALEEGALPPGSVAAEDVSFDPVGSISATDVQAAIAEVAAEAGGGGVYPYHVSVIPGAGQSGGTGFTPDSKFTWANGQNGETIEWDVLLAAGEYNVRVKYWAASDAGIAEFAMDDGGGFDNIDQAPYTASGFQVDAYSSGSDTDAGARFTGLSVAADGVYRLRVTINGKNASSSGTDTWLKQIDFQRVSA